MNVSRRLATITDGLSQTAVASEGKVQTPVAGNCFGSASNGSMLFPPYRHAKVSLRACRSSQRKFIAHGFSTRL